MIWNQWYAIRSHVRALEHQLDWIISWLAVGHSDDHYSSPFLLTPRSSQQLCSATTFVRKQSVLSRLVPRFRRQVKT